MELQLGPFYRRKKGTKRHTKHLISVLMCYLRRLDGIPKSDLLAVSYPLKNNKGSVQSSVASQNPPSTLSTVLVHTCKRSVSFQSNKF